MSTVTERYYFNIITLSETIHDREGTELSSLQAARTHAIDDARGLMSTAVLEGRDISGRHIEITNEAEEVLLIVAFREALTGEGDC
jgi:hypothetical protein